MFMEPTRNIGTPQCMKIWGLIDRKSFCSAGLNNTAVIFIPERQVDFGSRCRGEKQSSKGLKADGRLLIGRSEYRGCCGPWRIENILVSSVGECDWPESPVSVFCNAYLRSIKP